MHQEVRSCLGRQIPSCDPLPPMGSGVLSTCLSYPLDHRKNQTFISLKSSSITVADLETSLHATSFAT